MSGIGSGLQLVWGFVLVWICALAPILLYTYENYKSSQMNINLENIMRTITVITASNDYSPSVYTVPQ